MAISGTTTFRIYLKRFFKFGKSFSTMIGISFVSNFLWSEEGKENHWVPTLVPGATRCLSFRTRRMLVDCVSETHLSCLECRVLRKLVKMRTNHIKYCWSDRVKHLLEKKSSWITNNLSDCLFCSIALYFHLLFVLWRARRVNQNTAEFIKILRYVTVR